MTSWTLNVEPAPAILVLPPGAVSLDEAHAAIELWEHYSRKTLDPTQRLAVEIMMAETVGKRWAAQTTGREMARQNGKGDEIEVVELWGIVQRAEAILHTIHDAVLLATETQARMLGVLDHKDLRSKIKRKWTGTGQQMIEMRNGGTIWYRTRSGGGGRGADDIDRVVVDEAQHATPEQLAAMTPTLFANSNPQLNMVGTAGLPGRSGPWWAVRKRALLEEPGPLGYLGHTAEALSLDGEGRVRSVVPEDITDEALWIATNPAITYRPAGKLEFLREQFHRLGPVEFAQEHLCVWAPEPGADSSGPIDLAVWDSLIDATSTPDPASCRIAIDTNPERTWFTVCLAGERDDGLVHAEITKSFPDKVRAVTFAMEAADRLGVRVVVSEASGLAGEFTDPDVMKPGEFAAATSKLIDATRGEAPVLRHRGEPALRRAIEMAQTKPYSDGGVAWSRRTTSGDISPLTALTMAYGRLGVKTDELVEVGYYGG